MSRNTWNQVGALPCIPNLHGKNQHPVVMDAMENPKISRLKGIGFPRSRHHRWLKERKTETPWRVNGIHGTREERQGKGRDDLQICQIEEQACHLPLMVLLGKGCLLVPLTHERVNQGTRQVGRTQAC